MNKKTIATIIIFVAFLIGLASFFISTETLYSPFNKNLRLTGISYDDNGESTPAKTLEDGLADVNLSLKDVTFFEETDQMKALKVKMIEFFKSEYNVDVTEKITSIDTYQFYKEDNICGFHVPGFKNVYVNSYAVSFKNADEFAYTWCHEVIHLLGLDYVHYYGIYETITEAVNNSFFRWMEKEIPNTSLYLRAAETIGYQLITANPSLVSKSLSDETFDISDEINSVLSDAKYSCAALEYNSTIAYQYNELLTSLINQNANYWYYSEDHKFMIQEITTAYCRSFNLTKEEIDAQKAHWLLEDFDEYDLKAQPYSLKYSIVK